MSPNRPGKKGRNCGGTSDEEEGEGEGASLFGGFPRATG